jgi:hypothetical protein
MLSAKEIVRSNQRVIPKDFYPKKYYIIHRDPLKGDLAAEVALSGWSHNWLVAVYSDKTGPVRELWQTGLDSRERAMAYVKELQDLARQLKNGTEIDLTWYDYLGKQELAVLKGLVTGFWVYES